MKRRLLLTGITLVLLSASAFAEAPLGASAKGKAPESASTLLYFYSSDCDRCARTRSDVMPRIEDRFRGALKFEYKDIGDPQVYLRLFRLKQENSADEKSVFPVLSLNGRFIDGREESNLTYESLSGFINNALNVSPSPVYSGGKTKTDIMGYFNRLGPFTVMAAGLADGINPCSFTVIVFFMSFLFVRGYDRGSVAVAGAVFILSAFITYLFIGAGLLGSLRALKGFWEIAAILNIGIGIMSIVLGLVSAYDAVIFLRTGAAGSMVLQLPKKIKDKIHKTIGDGYRDKKNISTITSLVMGTFAIGFTVSIFESVCTGQLYLPTIIFVLKTTPYKMEAITKLIAYNLMFIVPLAVVYILALFGINSSGFGGFMKRHLFLIKIAMAILFIVLGASLVHADEVKKTSSPVHFDEKAWPTRNDPNYWDFGDVLEGVILKKRFHLVNNEKEPLGITKVNTSCACTATKMDASVVKPGKKVPIEIQFDTKGYPGERVRYIFVHTDSVKNPIIIFEIRANVIAK